MKDRTFNTAIVIFFIICGWLLFANLSEQALWNDEGFTASISRNTLKYGYPSSFDGLNYLYPDSPEFNWPGTYICRVDPWFPIYITALSFKLFGVSTWSARIVFAAAGFFALIILYTFCIRFLRAKSIGLLSVLLLATSAPFLLHARQARYYGIVILLCLIIFYSYYRIIEGRKGYLWLGIACALLSLSHHGSFVPIFGSVWIMALFIDRDKIQWKSFIAMSIIPVFFFLAWIVFSWSGMSDTVAFPVNTTLTQIKKNFEFQIRTINNYFVPVVFWILVVIAFRFSKKYPVIRLSDKEKGLFIRIGMILALNIIFFTIFGLRTMRYYVHYLPFLCLAEAVLLLKLFRWKKSVALIILLLAIFTNFLSRPNPLFLTKGLPAPLDVSEHSKFRAYLLSYLYEITHEYIGPLEALCDYLKRYAEPGDRIKIVKGDLTVIFYHPELIVLNDERYFKKTYPEWLVIRKYWNPIFEKKWRIILGDKIDKGYLDVLDRYERIPLSAVDSIRENVPDNLEEHFFRSPEITPENQMVVYRLKE